MHEAIASSLQRRQVITSTEIKKILGYYKKVTDFIEKKHHEKVHTGGITAQFNDICLAHFRNILKSKEKQSSWDRFFKKWRLSSDIEGGSKEKKQKQWMKKKRIIKIQKKIENRKD